MVQVLIMEDSNISLTSMNITTFRRDLYTGFELILYFGCTLPTTFLSATTIVALLVAKNMNKKIRVILINIFVAEIVLSLRLSATFLGYPIRQLFGLGEDFPIGLCNVQVSFGIIGVLSKVGSITFYALMVYVFIKYNIKKVKWYMLVIPLIVIWAISIGFSLPVAVRARNPPLNFAIFKGFCHENLEFAEEFISRSRQFLIQLIIGWILQAVICGGIIITFSILIFWFAKKNLSSDSDKAKKAIANNLLFLSVGGLLSIFNGVVLPTIIFAAAPVPTGVSDLEKTFKETSISDHVVDTLLSLTSLYTPVVTIILLKPIRDAMKQLINKCCKLDQRGE